jgi:hypothetical protein
MSNRIYGNAKTLQDVCKPKGHDFAVSGFCSVDTPSIYNRKTLASTLSRNAKLLGGFDERAWNPPTLAVVADMNDEEFIFDGDHSRWMFCMAFPDKEVMPCRRVKVANLKELSALFVHWNKYGKKELTPEEIFVHEYLAEKQNAVIIARHLATAGLQVSLGTDEENTSVGSSGGKSVSIRGFKNALAGSSMKAVTQSSRTIQRVWANEREVKSELLCGLAIAINDSSILADPKWAPLFDSYLKLFCALGKKQGAVSKEFKIAGGKIGNQDYNCVAVGFLKGFRAWGMNNKHFSKGTFRKYFGPRQDAIEKEIKNAVR